MKLNWFRNKQNHMLLKLVVPILLMGFAFRLVFFRSTTVSPILEQTPIAQKNVVPIPIPIPSPNPNPKTVSPILEETPIAQNSVVPNPNPNSNPGPNPNPTLNPPVFVQVQENKDQVPPKGNLNPANLCWVLLFLHFLWVLGAVPCISQVVTGPFAYKKRCACLWFY